MSIDLLYRGPLRGPRGAMLNMRPTDPRTACDALGSRAPDVAHFVMTDRAGRGGSDGLRVRAWPEPAVSLGLSTGTLLGFQLHKSDEESAAPMHQLCWKDAPNKWRRYNVEDKRSRRLPTWLTS